MIVGVVSDTHGDISRVVKKLNELEPDVIIHLGDNSKDGLDIEKELKVEVIGVRGNCDYYDRKTLLEKLIVLENKKILITHGHEYNIKNDIRNLYYRGKELGADIVLFGHTHVPYLFQEDNINIFNPGSGALPRAGSNPSIGIIRFEVDNIFFEHVDI